MMENRLLRHRYLAQTLGRAMRTTLGMGPLAAGRMLLRYPWSLTFSKVNRIFDNMLQGRTGPYAEATAFLLREIISESSRDLTRAVCDPSRLILNEDLVPPEILFGMGLSTWFTEFLGFLLPMINPEIAEQYIDAGEAAGVPPDICSLPRHIMGIASKGHLPAPAAVVTSNSPCDGGMASYTVIGRELSCPVFRLDVPYHFSGRRAEDYFIGELRQMIAWLAKNTPGRMDWDRLKAVCEERNRMQEAEASLWDMLRLRPAPMAAEPVYLNHLWGFVIRPGMPHSTFLMEKIRDLAAENVAQGRGALANERFRMLLWGPFPAYLTRMWSWAERTFGISLIVDSLSYNRLDPIDTSSEEAMLRSLARIVMAGPMARHSRGPARNYFDDLFHAVENFQIDMLWLAGHVGCKNARALNGMLRERCREKGIPLLILEYDLSDGRIVPEKDVKAQVVHFMENVMKAEPN
ncbi:MAG: 2-hydroxyacyl-CoA dehydratase family protein [Thermodesulfobacteriota bacterium]